jgi:phosphotransferase system enzyme I (PtsI)
MDGRRALRGIAAAPGVTAGLAVVFDRRSVVLSRRTTRHADERGEQQEIERLQEALSRSRARFEEVRRSLASDPELTLLLDAQLLLHKDELLLAQAEGLIRGGASAEHAVRGASLAIAERLAVSRSPYLAERARDVEQVGEAIVRELVGTGTDLPQLYGPSVLVAWDLSPAEALRLPRGLLLGIATEQGSARGHTALLARALHVPAVVGIADVTRLVEPGERVVLDGLGGLLVIQPTDEDALAADVRGTRYRAFTDRLRARAPSRAHTACGQHIRLLANVELEVELEEVREAGAEGIGLYRTEFLFLGANEGRAREEAADPCDEEAQTALFSRVVSRMAPEPTTLRVFDLGADKLSEPRAASQGPLGLRGIRLALSRPDLLDAQLRAFLRAAAHGPVRVMFPMIATLEELRRARTQLALARAELEARAVPFGDVEVGAMIELPSAVFMIDAIARECDFISVGTNDLAQYSLALDRTDPHSASHASELEPAMFRALERIFEGAERAGCAHAVCGDLASHPLAIPLLVGLGYRTLSMPSGDLPLAREVLLRIDVETAERAAARVLGAGTASEVETIVFEELGPLLSDLWEEQGLPPRE